MKRVHPAGAWVTVLCALGVLAGPGCGRGRPPHKLKLRVLTLQYREPRRRRTPTTRCASATRSYEDYMGAQIPRADSDVVFLQEVLPLQTAAEEFDETDAARTCYQVADRPAARAAHPGARLLGGLRRAPAGRVHGGQGHVRDLRRGRGRRPRADGRRDAAAAARELRLRARRVHQGQVRRGVDRVGGQRDHGEGAPPAGARAPQRPRVHRLRRVLHGDICRKLQNAAGLRGAGGLRRRAAHLDRPQPSSPGTSTMDPVSFSDADRGPRCGTPGSGRGSGSPTSGPRTRRGQSTVRATVPLGGHRSRPSAESATGKCQIFGEAELGPPSGTARLDEGFDFCSLPGRHRLPRAPRPTSPSSATWRSTSKPFGL